MASTEIQYQSDQHGVVTAVVVPIDVWHEITSELETNHLLKSETMKQRLLQAKARSGGFSIEEVLEQVGVTQDDVE